jgi:hypothetical protein
MRLHHTNEPTACQIPFPSRATRLYVAETNDAFRDANSKLGQMRLKLPHRFRYAFVMLKPDARTKSQEKRQVYGSSFWTIISTCNSPGMVDCQVSDRCSGAGEAYAKA